MSPRSSSTRACSWLGYTEVSLVLQQILVGIVVLGAAAFVVRRIVDAVRPKADPPGCDACAMHESIDRPPKASTSR